MSTTDDPAPPSDVTNPDQREALLAKTHEQLQAEREQDREAVSIKARLERKAETQTFEIDIFDEPVAFRRVPGAENKGMMTLTERWANIAELEDDESVQQAYDERFEETYEYLAEYSVDEELTAEWWASILPLDEAIRKVRALAQGGELSPEEIDRFRRE